MKKFCRTIIPITILLLCTLYAACDSETWEGTLSLRGNEPHTQLVLMTPQGKAYELTGPLSAELLRHQHRNVVIRGKKISEAAGPGFPAKIAVDKIIRVNDK